MESSEGLARLVSSIRRKRLRLLPVVDQPYLARVLAGIDEAQVIDAAPIQSGDVGDWLGLNAVPPYDECVIGVAGDGTTVTAWLVWSDKHDAGWTVRLFAFAADRGTPAGPIAVAVVELDADGLATDASVDVVDVPVGGLDRPAWAGLRVALRAFDFLNCANVELAEPARGRHLARRIGRLGVQVKTLVVYPTRTSGRLHRGRKGDPQPLPLTSVRGHYAHYGDCCPGAHPPAGLAFGKLTGRYWVPAFARGDASHGRVLKTYEMRAGRGMRRPSSARSSLALVPPLQRKEETP